VTEPAVIVRHVDLQRERGVAAAMDDVMQRAYRPPGFRAQIDLFGDLQPDGIIVAEDGETIVGTGCCIAYADAGFGWIGLIATEPAYERRGIGRALTEEAARTLAAHGCASVLDASAAGAPLYSRMGFTDCGATRVLERGRGSTARPARVTVIDAAAIDDIVAYDREVFGGDRRRLLSRLVERNPDRAAVARSPGGRVIGYAVSHNDLLGPVAADDGDTLADLVAFAATLDHERPLRVLMPPESTHGATFAELGFETTRELRHMRRDLDRLPGDTGRYASRVGLAFG